MKARLIAIGCAAGLAGLCAANSAFSVATEVDLTAPPTAAHQTCSTVNAGVVVCGPTFTGDEHVGTGTWDVIVKSNNDLPTYYV